MNEIPQLHKEQCCAACRWCSWSAPNSWAYICGKAKPAAPVDPWNICPQYEASEKWKAAPEPRSGPWVVRGT